MNIWEMTQRRGFWEQHPGCRHRGFHRPGRVDSGQRPQREGEPPAQTGERLCSGTEEVGAGVWEGGAEEGRGSAVTELHKYSVFIVLSVDSES